MDNAAHVIPLTLAKELNVLGLRWHGESLVMAVPNSRLSNEVEAIVAQVSSQLSLRVIPQPVEDSRISDARAVSYSDVATRLGDAINIPENTSEGPISELVNNILDQAIRMRASDIHIEPGQNDLVVRIRIDGLLEEMIRLPSTMSGPLVSRLKVQAKMNIVERRRPQDGQFSFNAMGHDYDVRISTVSTLFGEKAELRMLDTSRAVQDLQDLGMSQNAYLRYKSLIDSQHGLVIAAGPTGSGKTTTLQSSIRALNTPERNISTIEDPIEYVVPGVNHLPVIEEIGVGFAEQLRALLRQDPDVILVGESRDGETARISIQAAMAGRLVLTSLHAPDAVNAIYRLFQMDVEPHMVAAAIRGIIAQRLLRRNCVYCSEKYQASTAEKLLLNIDASQNVELVKGVGCTICRGTGYLDRVGVYQILTISDKMRELISQRPDTSKLNDLAAKEGTKTLVQEAYDLVLQGLTTVTEVSRLAGSDV